MHDQGTSRASEDSGFCPRQSPTFGAATRNWDATRPGTRTSHPEHGGAGELKAHAPGSAPDDRPIYLEAHASLSRDGVSASRARHIAQ